ncbi:MAG TPA: hypothetical protein PL152_00300 [Steroidobacteraceae bacterium]|nr:hypothetical protein [Steroidobacteraceae bacterium]HQR47739.1 hypothetical protein [Steroidobacteraceae bacterium]
MARPVSPMIPGIKALVLWLGLTAAAVVVADDLRQAHLFLRSNHIYIRIPDGPEYRVEVDSPVYEEYAREHGADCETPPEVREKVEIRQFYKPSKGGVPGRVRVELLVGPAGRVVAIQALESGAGGLSLYSVLYATRRWIFEPGRDRSGQAAFCRYPVSVEFVLPDTQG